MVRKILGKTRFTSLIVLSAVFIVSCGSTKNVPYFQDVSLDAQSELSNTAKFTEPVIQADDILSVSIFTIDPATGMIVNQVASQVMGTQGNAASTQNATPSTSGFIVDKNGEIELSLLGKMKVAGLTTFQAKDLIRNRASNSYQNPNVQVRFANFKITILGEVTKPASYIIPNEKVSILDALGLAGDLTIYGRRENVILIRDIDGKKEFARINLNSKDIFTSPYYYLRQNDVIYVEPNKGKAATLNQARTQTIALIGTALTVVAALVARLF
ncbi:polysaccharide biosynthesis/export family protein [Pedobacter deserti]|uniref:polysaccharide biosynthesis/export family protein n=1 Tax=Pedobacter deserti TaxID=2817382 RepID=UPI00210A25C2|nr:polysaccharide biosynthesis/export family protein [Pedobacter sp. SYSU D00382]